MHIENTGDSPIRLTAIHFHPEPAWDAISCNELQPGDELGVFQGRLLDSKEVYQCMHVLVPKRGNVEGEMPFALGRAEIDWVGSMGEKGSSITGVMKRRPV
jgi:Protein of unknown function (DUF974)